MSDRITVMDFGAIGDGITDDTQAIQKGLNFSASTGKTLIFPGGYVFIYSSRCLIRSNTSLVVEKGATLKRNGSVDGYTWINGDGTGSGGYGDCTNVSIELQGIVDLNGYHGRPTSWLSFAHGDGLHIFGGGQVINGYEGHQIELNSYRNVLIENIKFPTHDYSGTNNYECIQIDFSNQAGFPAFGPWDNTPCANVVIQNCVFGTGQAGLGSHSTPVSAMHNNIKIINNTLGTHVYGIRAQGWKNSLIANNVMNNMAERGILTYACENLKIVNNFIEGGCTSFGIQVSQTTVDSVAYKPQRNFVAGNTLNNVAGVGIYISSGSSHLINSNQIYNCGQEAIQTATGCSRVKISQNIIQGASVSSVGTYPALRVASESVTVSNNDIGPDSDGTTFYNYGCYASSGSLRCNFNGNKITKGTIGYLSHANKNLLTAFNNRVLLYSSNGISTGTAVLSDSLDNYIRLEVIIGSASGATMSMGSVVPYSDDGSWAYGAENFNITGITNDLKGIVTDATSISITSNAAILRKVYGIREVY